MACPHTITPGAVREPARIPCEAAERCAARAGDRRDLGARMGNCNVKKGPPMRFESSPAVAGPWQPAATAWNRAGGAGRRRQATRQMGRSSGCPSLEAAGAPRAVPWPTPSAFDCLQPLEPPLRRSNPRKMRRAALTTQAVAVHAPLHGTVPRQNWWVPVAAVAATPTQGATVCARLPDTLAAVRFVVWSDSPRRSVLLAIGRDSGARGKRPAPCRVRAC